MGSGSSSSASAQKYDATRASHRFDKTSIRDLAGATWTAAHDVRFEACASYNEFLESMRNHRLA